MTVQIVERLTRIEEKVSSLMGSQQSWQAQSGIVHNDFEMRMRENERQRWQLPVAALTATISAAGSIMVAIIAIKGG